MNVALYGRPGARWAMTERGAGSLERTESLCRIGPSRLTWTGQAAVVDLNEMAVPIPRPIRGRVTVTPKALNAADFELDAAGRHRWWPVAPCARIKVEMEAPKLSWEGTGYLDSNRGSRPLETDFQSWNWSRTDTAKGDTVVHYDVIRRGGEGFDIAHRFRPDGTEHAYDAPPQAPLPPILWRVDRTARSEDPMSAKVLKTLEDTPFYSRSAIRTVLDGGPAHGVHESLNLDRFDSRWVQVLLPFRMPRLGR
jgi:carotenoid 1,2-hydratase